MLQEGKTCIITDYSGLKSDIDKRKQSSKQRKAIAEGLSRLTPEKLKKVYERK